MRKNIALILILGLISLGATKNIVPRADGEGQIGTSAKQWGIGVLGTIQANTGTLNLEGVGGTYNEDLLFDFETEENKVNISSSTGVTQLDINSLALQVDSLDCSGNANGGALTASAAGLFSCTDDDDTTYTLTKAFTLINPNAAYDVDTQFVVWEDVPVNMTVTKLSVTCDAAGNEIAGDLKWADAFIGFANATVINAFDTTSGVLIDSSITAGAVVAGKDIYIDFDSQPNSAITQCGFTIKYTED